MKDQQNVITANQNNTTSNNSNNLFDIRQSPVDQKFRVWVQRSDVDLGIVDRAEYEEAGKPIYLSTSRWVVVSVHDKRPTVQSVLEMLGVRSKPRADGGNNRGQQPKGQRNKGGQRNRPTANDNAQKVAA